MSPFLVVSHGCSAALLCSVERFCNAGSRAISAHTQPGLRSARRWCSSLSLLRTFLERPGLTFTLTGWGAENGSYQSINSHLDYPGPTCRCRARGSAARSLQTAQLDRAAYHTGQLPALAASARPRQSGTAWLPV